MESPPADWIGLLSIKDSELKGRFKEKIFQYFGAIVITQIIETWLYVNRCCIINSPQKRHHVY